jgi:hypothetical protein
VNPLSMEWPVLRRRSLATDADNVASSLLRSEFPTNGFG